MVFRGVLGRECGVFCHTTPSPTLWEHSYPGIPGRGASSTASKDFSCASSAIKSDILVSCNAFMASKSALATPRNRTTPIPHPPFFHPFINRKIDTKLKIRAKPHSPTAGQPIVKPAQSTCRKWTISECRFRVKRCVRTIFIDHMHGRHALLTTNSLAPLLINGIPISSPLAS